MTRVVELETFCRPPFAPDTFRCQHVGEYRYAESQCGQRAARLFEGKHYCGVHYPPRWERTQAKKEAYGRALERIEDAESRIIHACVRLRSLGAELPSGDVAAAVDDLLAARKDKVRNRSKHNTQRLNRRKVKP